MITLLFAICATTVTSTRPNGNFDEPVLLEKIKEVVRIDLGSQVTALSASGSDVVFGTANGLIGQVSLRDYRITEIGRNTDAVRAIAVSPNGQYIYSGDFDGNLVSWCAKSRKIVGKTRMLHTINSIASSSQNIYVGYGDVDESGVKGISLADGTPVLSMLFDDRVYKIAVFEKSPDRLVVWSSGRGAAVVTVASRKRDYLPWGGLGPRVLGHCSEAGLLAIGRVGLKMDDSEYGSVAVVDFRTQIIVGNVDNKKPYGWNDAFFIGGGTHLVVCGAAGPRNNLRYPGILRVLSIQGNGLRTMQSETPLLRGTLVGNTAVVAGGASAQQGCLFIVPAKRLALK